MSIKPVILNFVSQTRYFTIAHMGDFERMGEGWEHIAADNTENFAVKNFL
jgi:hypothetical protein